MSLSHKRIQIETYDIGPIFNLKEINLKEINLKEIHADAVVLCRSANDI
jgi:hypothetical protein